MTKNQIDPTTVQDPIETKIGSMNTSQSIRYLSSIGYSTSGIYNYLKGKKFTKDGNEIRYQHVRNVLNQKVNEK